MKNHRNSRDRFHAQQPWWKRVLAVAFGHAVADPDGERIAETLRALSDEEWTLRGRLKHLKSEIKTAKHVQERFFRAEKRRARQPRIEFERQEKAARFRDASLRHQAAAFDRQHFRIRPKDYKRGNPVENYLRNRLFREILDTFDGACAYCGATSGLTLDHYGLPKNEGGNFVLFHEEDGVPVLNLVVLCRSCNSAKGENAYTEFFDATTMVRVHYQQESVLSILLDDERFMSVFRKWYR